MTISDDITKPLESKSGRDNSPVDFSKYLPGGKYYCPPMDPNNPCGPQSGRARHEWLNKHEQAMRQLKPAQWKEYLTGKAKEYGLSDDGLEGFDPELIDELRARLKEPAGTPRKYVPELVRLRVVDPWD